MTRIHLACYALIASAFVLAALVFSAAGRQFDRGPASILDSEALGGMVVSKNLTTVLTAEGVGGSDDFVYILDNKNERLLCYAPSQQGKDTLDLFAGIDVGAEMEKVMKAFGGRRGR